MADRIAIISIGVERIIFDMDIENSMNMGASFCQKDSIKQTNQLEEFITFGNHWWNGTIASFTKIPSIINIWGLMEEDILPPSKINNDPKAWGKKYLMGASL